MAKGWFVHTLLFENDRAYVAIGTDWEPERLFNIRHRRESELNDALRESDDPPVAQRIETPPLHRTEAFALRRGIEQQLRQAGQRLLSARDRSTYRGGTHKPRPVYVIHAGKRCWFSSVGRAARALGKDPSTVWQWTKEGKKAWFDAPGAQHG